MSLRTNPLHPRFGAVVDGVDLRQVTSEHLFPEIRAAFETHSALLFPAQSLSEDDHIRLAQYFGPLENRPAMASGRDLAFEVSNLSNKTENGVLDPEDLKALNLRANQLWHTDSTFLPVPALVNILMAEVVPSTGGETEFASTRAAWADMPPELKDPLTGAIIWHRFSHSRARISPELANWRQISQWPDRPWRSVWTNPVTGEDALYIASHAFTIEGMGIDEGEALIDRAIAFCTQPHYVYAHNWQPGDVLLWDERAILHRGCPWPMEEPRVMKSICCSATEADGLESVRIV